MNVILRSSIVVLLIKADELIKVSNSSNEVMNSNYSPAVEVAGERVTTRPVEATSSLAEAGLPIIEALAKASKFNETTTYIYDSLDSQVDFDLWLDDRFGEEAVDESALGPLAEELDDLTDAWKIGIDMNCDISERAPSEVPIYEDTTLVVPLGGSKILWSWLLMQSLLAGTVYPKTILLITGLNKANDEAMKFKSLQEYIISQFIPRLPAGVDVKWAVFEGPGNAGVSRALGARLTNTTYVIYHDADDVLGHSALEMKIQTLRTNPDISQVLGAYTGCESSEPHIEFVNAYLDKVASEERPVDKLLALDDLCRAYCATSYDVAEKLAFDKESAIEEVMMSFTFRGTIDLKDVTNWPQLRWFRDCNETLQLIEETESQHSLNDISRAAEQRAVDWFSKSCGNREIEPEYVGGCHNGWGAIRTEVFKQMPLVYPYFGEDSMLTFMISHSNHTSVCVKNATGGVYVMYRRPEVATVSNEIFPEPA